MTTPKPADDASLAREHVETQMTALLLYQRLTMKDATADVRLIADTLREARTEAVEEMMK